MTTSTTRGSFAAMYEASRQMSHDASPRQLRLDQLEPNPDQPRQLFTHETLEELATSIKTYGVLQPLVVRPHPTGVQGKYQIVAGERRFQACKLAGLEAVPVVIKTLTDQAVREVALIENLQRENITPMEEAQVLKQILDETGLSHRELGDRIGKTKAYVEQRVRMLRYPEEVQHALSVGPESGAVFSPGHAKAVVQLDDAEARESLIRLIDSQALSVREAERRVHQLKRVKESIEDAAVRAKLAGDVLRPDGVSEAAIEAALAPRTTREKVVPAAGAFDLRELAVGRLVLEAQKTGQWTVSVDELQKLLKSDLAALK